MHARARRRTDDRAVLMVEQGGRGGVSDYADALTAALAGDGWRVTLFTARDHRYPPRPGREDLAEVPYVRDGTAVARWLRRTGLSKVVNGVALLALLPRVFLLARRHAVIHLHGAEFWAFQLLWALLGRAAGAGVVITAHNSFVRRGGSRARDLSHRVADLVVVHTAADVPAMGPSPRRVEVVRHGTYADLAARGVPVTRAAARRACGVPDGALAVLLFGQLRPDKGIEDVLVAAAALDGVHVLMAGEDRGGLEPARALVDAAQAAGRLTLDPRFVDADRTAELFAAADVVVLPYRQASASGVLLLAYGSARPVVVYPVPGLQEYLVDGETAWVCTAPTPDALSAALAACRAAGRAELDRRGEAARAFADRELGWGAIARRTGELYREVASRRGSRS